MTGEWGINVTCMVATCGKNVHGYQSMVCHTPYATKSMDAK